MDLYRYFHPHHNPRLRSTSLRLQEIAELEQVAVELRKAIKRAQLRTEKNPVGGISAEHFTDLLAALEFSVDALSSLTKTHPGDDLATMNDMLNEREEAPGWENWARLLRQRLSIMKQYDGELPKAS